MRYTARVRNVAQTGITEASLWSQAGLKRQCETTIKQVHLPQEGPERVSAECFRWSPGKGPGRANLAPSSPRLCRRLTWPTERDSELVWAWSQPQHWCQYSGSLATVIKESDIKDLDLKKFQAWIGLFKEGSDWRWVDGYSTEYNISEVFASVCNGHVSAQGLWHRL
ncbi:hypothetical protein WMY93_012818 [Mugilogobius chulae]|uniref:C-type lectin domain-containing protein n=1 Tax=Mugilogobius chulae TaxID=88201 RepID=A0AAW0P8B8_9GOBI